MADVPSSGFTLLGFDGPGSIVAPAPPPVPVRLTRYGVAVVAGATSGGDGPTWSEVKGAVSTNSGLAGKIKVHRLYLTPAPAGGVAQPFSAVYADILDADAQGAICIVSHHCTTQSEFDQFRTDQLSFASAHPAISWISVGNHEPNNNFTAAAFVANQMMHLAACNGIAAAVPAFIYNGFWWSGSSVQRKNLIAQGGFPAWAPDSMLQGFLAQNGYAGMDAYPGAHQAMPGNTPPTNATPGENAGARIRNFAAWCAGIPFTDDKGSVTGSTTVMPRLLCGEIGDFDVAQMQDTFVAISQCLDVASFWNHRSFGSALENTSPTLTNGNGGNPNSAQWKSTYIAAVDNVTALGGPPAIR